PGRRSARPSRSPVYAERKARVDRLGRPRLAYPGMVGVVADQPLAPGARARHHVQVVHVIARWGHRRAVPAVRDQDHVTTADLGQDIDRSFTGAVDPLVAKGTGWLRRCRRRALGAHLEVVD